MALKNYTKITETPNDKFKIIENSEKCIVINMMIHNGNATANPSIKVQLTDEKDDILCTLIDQLIDPKETIFLDNFKLFMNDGQNLVVSSSISNIHFLVSCKED